MSEPLDATPVYRNLRFKSAFFGLTPLDLPLIIVPGGVVLLACMLFGATTLWSLVVAAAIGVSLVALKWRKPNDHLETMLLSAFSPRRLSHKAQDISVSTFPVRADLSERRVGSPTSEASPSSRNRR